jgi:AraC-like DNA-binding protein/mannose-6-phosphate isomerase-like protein (cupin superfamily)
MDYSFLDKEEYKDIHLYRIIENNNGLPFFIVKLNNCSQSKHRHEYVQIIYISKGRLKHVINNNVFDVYKGDIFVIPPFVPHYFIDEFKEKYEFIEFEFIPEFINEKFSLDFKESSFMDFAYLEPFLVTENEVKPRLNLTGSLQLEVEDIFREIIREYEIRDSDFVYIIKSMLMKLLILVGREFKKNINGTESQRLYERHRDALNNALKYISENYNYDVSLDEAARVAMLSTSYFSYLFKQMTQKTFTEYVNSMRIAKAAELLKTRHDMKIVDICFEVGYNNINHFNRIFRQETGTKPMDLRKARI